MKKYIALICVILMVILTACEAENPINTMEKLTEVDGVISVEALSFATDVEGAVAYKVTYESENGKLVCDVVLPDDYTNENKNYSVLIYFPDAGADIDSLAANYALNDIIVIRHHIRGFGESDGIYDFGGERDLADSKKLIEIFDTATFVRDSKIFVAGSVAGSVNALRLMAEDTENRISGCAVADPITDVPAFIDFRGDQIESLTAALIGKTYEEAPEEYDLRSAIKFVDKLEGPILIINHLQNPFVSVDHSDALYDLLKDNGKDCTYHKLDEFASDFYNESLKRLLSWMNKYE